MKNLNSISAEDMTAIKDWLENKPIIIRAWIFGSRARTDFRPDSDLDLAIEHGIMPGDTDEHTTSIGEIKTWTEELQPNISLSLDLQSYIQGESEIIDQGLKRSSILIWDKTI